MVKSVYSINEDMYLPGWGWY